MRLPADHAISGGFRGDPLRLLVVSPSGHLPTTLSTLVRLLAPTPLRWSTRLETPCCGRWAPSSGRLAPTALAVSTTNQAAVLPPNAPGALPCALLTRCWRIRDLASRASMLRVPTLGISPRSPDSDSASLWHPIAAALPASDVTVASLRSPPALPATAGRRGGSRRRQPRRIPLFTSHSPHARGPGAWLVQSRTLGAEQYLSRKLSTAPGRSCASWRINVRHRRRRL